MLTDQLPVSLKIYLSLKISAWFRIDTKLYYEFWIFVYLEVNLGFNNRQQYQPSSRFTS